MSRTARSAVATATRPNRILSILAAVWVAAAIAIGGAFPAQPATDTSASRTSSGAVSGLQP